MVFVLFGCFFLTPSFIESEFQLFPSHLLLINFILLCVIIN